MLRAFLPAALIAAVMSAIYMLPPFEEVESALDMRLDDFLGSWETKIYPPSEKELKILAGDTKFSKAHCLLRRVEEMSFIRGIAPIDAVDLSVVLSGHDLANSIHRPERCMPAQGHRALQSSSSSLELPGGHQLPITRILSKQDVSYGPEDDRQQITRNCLTYYFFVGHQRITESHTERTLIDIKDRILKGDAQRWAYVSATMPYAEVAEREFGDPPDLEMADKKIRQLLTELAESNIDWSQISH